MKGLKRTSFASCTNVKRGREQNSKREKKKLCVKNIFLGCIIAEISFDNVPPLPSLPLYNVQRVLAITIS